MILCARCGVPVRMTSLGCYGHLAPQRLDGAKPHRALARASAVEVPPVDRRCPDESGGVAAGESGMSPGGRTAGGER